MITSLSELQDFIVWAKSQKLKSVAIAGISFEFSEIAHIDGLQGIEANSDLSLKPVSSRLPDGNTQANEDEEMLFYSAR